MSTEASSLPAEQRLVLQTIYDYFCRQAGWPTFISIDRQLRREHGIDTAAILLTLPESFIVPPRSGTLRPTTGDKLRLRLLGINVCDSGFGDTDLFVRFLRWLAQQKMAYEPEPGSDATMLRITSNNVAAFLGIPTESPVMARLYAMLNHDNWGLSGSSSDHGWFVVLGPDIWRFRDVQTVADCIRVRGE